MRALAQISMLPPSAKRRRDEIKLQVAVITPLIHVKGYAAQETKAAVDRAHLLIEEAEALGEPVEDPLLLYSVLYGFSIANYVAFDADALRKTTTKLLELAQQQGSMALVVGHRLMGHSLLLTGKLADARAHYDQGLALYDPSAHRSLGVRFGQDPGTAILSHRSWVLWLLGHPNAAVVDVRRMLYHFYIRVS